MELVREPRFHPLFLSRAHYVPITHASSSFMHIMPTPRFRLRILDTKIKDAIIVYINGSEAFSAI